MLTFLECPFNTLKERDYLYQPEGANATHDLEVYV